MDGARRKMLEKAAWAVSNRDETNRLHPALNMGEADTVAYPSEESGFWSIEMSNESWTNRNRRLNFSIFELQ